MGCIWERPRGPRMCWLSSRDLIGITRTRKIVVYSTGDDPQPWCGLSQPPSLEDRGKSGVRRTSLPWAKSRRVRCEHDQVGYAGRRRHRREGCLHMPARAAGAKALVHLHRPAYWLRVFPDTNCCQRPSSTWTAPHSSSERMNGYKYGRSSSVISVGWGDFCNVPLKGRIAGQASGVQMEQ